MKRRLGISLIMGAVLGLVCILGATVRHGGLGGRELFIGALFYNRLVMGLLIGLAGELRITKGKWNWLVRGALLGTLVSFAFYFSTGFVDLVSFLAGTIYGIIIELVARRRVSS